MVSLGESLHSTFSISVCDTHRARCRLKGEKGSTAVLPGLMYHNSSTSTARVERSNQDCISLEIHILKHKDTEMFAELLVPMC